MHLRRLFLLVVVAAPACGRSDLDDPAIFSVPANQSDAPASPDGAPAHDITPTQDAAPAHDAAPTDVSEVATVPPPRDAGAERASDASEAASEETAPLGPACAAFGQVYSSQACESCLMQANVDCSAQWATLQAECDSSNFCAEQHCLCREGCDPDLCACLQTCLPDGASRCAALWTDLASCVASRCRGRC